MRKEYNSPAIEIFELNESVMDTNVESWFDGNDNPGEFDTAPVSSANL